MNQPRIFKDGEKSISSFSSLSFSDTPQNSPSSSSQSFASLMQKPQTPSSEQTSSLVSPFELVQAKSPIPDPHSLIAQMQQAQNTIEGIQGQMNHPNLKLKPSQKYLIKNKLVSANNNIRVVASKMGGSIEDSDDSDAAGSPSKGSSPVNQFIGYLTDGLAQLESTKRQVATLGGKPSLAPADFLLMQVKLSKAQQELEFTSTLLGSVINGFKQIMNIQL